MRYVFLLFSFLSFHSYSQNISEDSLYNLAKESAFSGNYDRGIELFKILIEKSPSNLDYGIFLGRVHTWKGDYEAAIKVLTPISNKVPAPRDAIEAIINAHLWNGNYSQAINYCNVGLNLGDTDSFFFALKKAIAMEKTGEDENALLVLSEILQKEADNVQALALRTLIYQKRQKEIALSYLNTSFSNPGFEPWHFAFIEFKRKFKKTPVVARANAGNMFSKTALQFELDLYRELGTKSYIYFSSGIAGGRNIFPGYRGGAEIYKNYQNKLTVSLGARYLHFKIIQVLMVTGEAAYKIKNWELAYRPFLPILNQELFPSHIIRLRKSNEIKESFLQFDFQYGIIPYHFFITNEFTRIKAIRIGVQYQKRLKKAFFIRPVFMYEYEAYYPGKYRNRFNTQIIFTKRF